MKRVTGSLLLAVAIGCARTAPAPPPPAPAPTAATTPAPVATTLDEARALRRAGKLDLYDQGLRELAKSTDAVTHRRALALLALEQYESATSQPGPLPAGGERVEVLGSLTRAAGANAPAAPFLRLRLVDGGGQRGDF